MRMSISAFRYMADAHAKGELVPDFEVREINTFRRELQSVADA